MKHILSFFILGCFFLKTNGIQAQAKYLPSTGQIISLNEKYKFSYVYEYDIELQESYNKGLGQSIIVVSITDGEGQLIVSLNGNKNYFKINSCYDKGRIYKFDLESQNGGLTFANLIIDTDRDMIVGFALKVAQKDKMVIFSNH